MTYPYKDDVGYELRVTLSFSLTGAVAAYLDVKKPGASTSVSWTCESTGYDDTTLYYITTSSTNGGFDTIGIWTIQPRVVFGAASSVSVHDTPHFLTVGEPV